MRAVLAAEIDDHIVMTLTMTKKELAQAFADPQLLTEAVRGACGEAVSEPQASAEPQKEAKLQEDAAFADCGGNEKAPLSEEASYAEKTEDPVPKSGEFSYKNIALSGLRGNKEAVLERAIELLIESNEIPVNMAEVESEADFHFKAIMQRMRYDLMFGRASDAETEMDPDELLAEIKEDLILEQKENYIFKKVIELEGFEASPEELYAEAEAMARRQDTTVEMVKSFFGDDLAGLAGDVKKRKAKDFLYALAVGE